MARAAFVDQYPLSSDVEWKSIVIPDVLSGRCQHGTVYHEHRVQCKRVDGAFRGEVNLSLVDY